MFRWPMAVGEGFVAILVGGSIPEGLPGAERILATLRARGGTVLINYGGAVPGGRYRKSRCMRCVSVLALFIRRTENLPLCNPIAGSICTRSTTDCPDGLCRDRQIA